MVISPTFDFSRAISSSRSSRSRSFRAVAAPESARSRHSVSLATETFVSRATSSNGSPRNNRATTANLRLTEKRFGPFLSKPEGAPAPALGERSGAPSGLRPSSFVMGNTPVEVQFTSAGCLNYPCRTSETDGAAGGLRERGVVQADPAQGAQQHIGHRVEPESQLVGAHCGGRGAVRIEVELTLLDAVLHLAACAIDLLVEMPGLARVAPKRGDDEARIGLTLGPLGLCDNPTVAAPASTRPPHEGLEAALRPAGALAPGGRKRELGCNLADQPLIACQSEQEVDAVGLTPGHQLLACEA